MFGWVNDVINWIGDAIVDLSSSNKVKVDGKTYNVYRFENGDYYYIDGNKTVKIENKNLIKELKNNNNKTYDINYGQGPVKKDTKTEPTIENVITNPVSQYNAKQQQQYKQQEQNRNDVTYGGKEPSSVLGAGVTSGNNNTSTGSGSGYSESDFWRGMYDSQVSANNELINRIENLENPKVLSAEEVAEILGIDYNEQNILNDYNKATNEYYDDAIAELNDIRQTYDRNNAMYYDQIMDSYLDSYKNMAPTASGKGALAATALSNMFASQQTNAAADYDVIQDILLNEKGREKELANNPNLAKQQYNDLGVAMSGLSANFNQAATKQYINSLNAYTTAYAADQSYRSQLANAHATKYSGLANAAATNANAYATRYNNSFTPYYNYYASRFGNQVADNYVANLIRTGSGGY